MEENSNFTDNLIRLVIVASFSILCLTIWAKTKTIVIDENQWSCTVTKNIYGRDECIRYEKLG